MGECTGDLCYLCKEIKQSVVLRDTMKYTAVKSQVVTRKIFKRILEPHVIFKELNPSWGLMS